MMKCSKCKEEKPEDAFAINLMATTRNGRHYICKPCAAEMERRRRLDNIEVYRERDHKRDKGRMRTRVLQQYGLTAEDYDAMLAAQGGVCAICCRPETANTRPDRAKHSLSVDHCHTSGAVRGLLCVRCNWALGKVEGVQPKKRTRSPEFLRRALAYLDMADRNSRSSAAS